MIEKIEISRRKLIAFMGVFSIFSQKLNAKQNLPAAPCSFIFDASRNGVSVRERFIVDTKRYYVLSLDFYHGGGEGAKKLAELLDANEALFTAESINSSHPIRVISDDFMEKKTFFSIHERNEALTQANRKYWDVVHKAINSKINNQKSEFVWRPQNLKGLIPISIEIAKVENNGIRNIIGRNLIDTIGTYAGGSGRFSREITGAVLSPGVYEIYAKTVRDSPLFFNVLIKLAVTYRPKI